MSGVDMAKAGSDRTAVWPLVRNVEIKVDLTRLTPTQQFWEGCKIIRQADRLVERYLAWPEWEVRGLSVLHFRPIYHPHWRVGR